MTLNDGTGHFLLIHIANCSFVASVFILSMETDKKKKQAEKQEEKKWSRSVWSAAPKLGFLCVLMGHKHASVLS